jgi:predicted CDP-diglyceride synthetase/phosphatidate cytidylyltransferase
LIGLLITIFSESIIIFFVERKGISQKSSLNLGIVSWFLMTIALFEGFMLEFREVREINFFILLPFQSLQIFLEELM